MMDTSGTTRISDNLENLELSYEKNTVSTDEDSSFDHPAKHSTRLESFNEYEACDGPEFYEIIPPLQNIVSFDVAIEFWRGIIKKKNAQSRIDESYVFFYEKDSFEVGRKFLDELPPEPYWIRDLVGKSLGAVRNEMIRWADDYIRIVSDAKSKRNWEWIDASHLLHCHWRPDGKIDDRRTALNMLADETLSQQDKFKIMCNYCLEQEIGKLSPDSLPERFTQQIRFKNNPLMFYWLCYLKGNLDTYPKRRRESVASYLITSSSLVTWSAIEYFWDKLRDDEKLTKALVLLKTKPQFQKEIFFKMNESERNQALSTKPIDILYNFFNLESCQRFAYFVWVRVVDTMNRKLFTDLIIDLLTISLPDNFERIRWLVKMWQCSPSRFKTDVCLDLITDKVVSLHIQTHCPEFSDRPVPLPCSPEFLLAFLSSASVESRKRVLFEYGDELVLHNDSPMIDRLMEISLLEPKDVSEFQSYLSKSPKIREYCHQMLTKSSDRYDLQQLAGFVTYYIPDPAIQSDFILALSASDYFMDSWNSAIELIDKYFEIPPEQVIQLKKNIIWSFGTSQMQLSWSNLYVREFATNVVTETLDAEELKRYKNIAAETIRTKYKWHHFDDQSIRGFLRWCFDEDDRKIAEFKKSLSVDDIFEYFWRFKMSGRFDNDPDVKIECDVAFSICDKILFWVFERSDDVKKFKLEKAADFRDRRVLEIDEVFLSWVFEGDRKEIEKFVLNFSNEDRS